MQSNPEKVNESLREVDPQELTRVEGGRGHGHGWGYRPPWHPPRPWFPPHRPHPGHGSPIRIVPL
jgi:hypothetical protein